MAGMHVWAFADPMAMKPPDSANLQMFQDKAFLLLVIAVSLAFAWILWPFYAAVFWATVLAILFAPLYRRLSRCMRQRRTLAALSTVMIILVMVILPAVLMAALLLQEGFDLYERLQSGELSFGRYLQHLLDAVPAWVTNLLDRFGLTNRGAVQERLSAAMMQGIQLVAAHALDVGQNTFDFIVSSFIMLYLLFFLLRDGGELSRRIGDAIPLQEGLQSNLFSKFTNVIRATIKGSVVVAIVQGVLGGAIFWVLGIHAPGLWGVLMAVLSLLPAVGTGLV